VVKACSCVGEWKSLAFDSMKRLKIAIHVIPKSIEKDNGSKKRFYNLANHI
jgi:hypothetical protein